MVIGYTTGVFDLFHVGHLNLLKNAKTMCDKLVVGVTIDKLVRYKYKKSVIPYKERIEIVKSCRYVDLAIPQNKIDKLEAFKKIKYDILFVGDDWYENLKCAALGIGLEVAVNQAAEDHLPGAARALDAV